MLFRSPALQRELQRISEDTFRCKRIIDDLRDFSRRHDLELAPSDLNRLVEDALGLISHQEVFSRITIVREFGSHMPAVPCDSARMEQVLANVLVNALQAMPQGGSLSVGTALRSDFAEISIHDTGPGIPNEIRSRIFDPFFTTKPQGTGLGLSIVYRIMEAHGGKVELESVTQGHAQEGTLRQVGTRVVLLLRLRAKNADTKAAAVH